MTGKQSSADGVRDPVARMLDLGLDREAVELATAQTRAHELLPGSTAGGPMDPLTQLDTLGPLLGGVVAGITRDQLDAPTPCARFAVRDVLDHMISGATTFAAAFRGRAPSAHGVDDVLDAFGPALSDLSAALHEPSALERTVCAPFGEVDGESFARFIVLDGLVHGWDLATATGQPYSPPDDLVAQVSDFASTVLDGMRGEETFGPASDPPPDATPIERLAAFTGRHVQRHSAVA